MQERYGFRCSDHRQVRPEEVGGGALDSILADAVLFGYLLGG
jgi:hypothetical protein